MSVEIERKFLIRKPDFKLIAAQPDCAVWRITQTYLKNLPGSSTERRVRRIEEDGEITHVYTTKDKLGGISREEIERTVPEEEYRRLLAEAETRIEKTRYRFPYRGHLMEIDVYPFLYGGPGLENRAVLEVELGAEDEEFEVPEFLEIERELTGTREFSNKSMAKPVK